MRCPLPRCANSVSCPFLSNKDPSARLSAADKRKQQWRQLAAINYSVGGRGFQELEKCYIMEEGALEKYDGVRMYCERYKILFGSTAMTPNTKVSISTHQITDHRT